MATALMIAHYSSQGNKQARGSSAQAHALLPMRRCTRQYSGKICTPSLIGTPTSHSVPPHVPGCLQPLPQGIPGRHLQLWTHHEERHGEAGLLLVAAHLRQLVCAWGMREG